MRLFASDGGQSISPTGDSRPCFRHTRAIVTVMWAKASILVRLIYQIGLISCV
ncbi:Hypothetical protein RAK1035_0928 [Roseovarius sp. AK1035]|nr:Hypothetical protein RAK1035_0928 [Roseovarius sp. AK1035]